jgi:hypothetical protein
VFAPDTAEARKETGRLRAMQARHILPGADLPDPLDGRPLTGMEVAGLKTDGILATEGSGNSQAEPGRAHIDGNARIEPVGRRDPEGNLPVALESFLLPPGGQRAFKAQPLLTCAEPFRERIQGKRFPKEATSQLMDPPKVAVVDIPRDDRLVPAIQLASLPGLELEKFHTVHAGHVEIGDHDVAAWMLVRAAIPLVAVEGTDRGRIVVGQDLVSPHEKEIPQHAQDEDLIIAYNDPRFPHLRSPVTA